MGSVASCFIDPLHLNHVNCLIKYVAPGIMCQFQKSQELSTLFVSSHFLFCLYIKQIKQDPHGLFFDKKVISTTLRIQIWLNGNHFFSAPCHA